MAVAMKQKGLRSDSWNPYPQRKRGREDVNYKSQTQLRLQFHYWFHEMLAGIFIFCAIVGSIDLIGATWDTFECNRSFARCTLTHHTWSSQQQRRWTLEQIKGVDLVPDGYQKNGSPRYQINLHTTEGFFRLPIVESVYADQSPQMADAIRQVLEQQRSQVQINRDNRPWTVFSIKFCLAFAGLLFILGQPVTVELNRETQRFTVRRWTPVGTRTREFPFNQIENVIVQKRQGGKYGSMGRLAIVLKNGRTIVVHGYDVLCPERESYESAATIEHFLGLAL